MLLKPDRDQVGHQNVHGSGFYAPEKTKLVRVQRFNVSSFLRFGIVGPVKPRWTEWLVEEMCSFECGRGGNIILK